MFRTAFVDGYSESDRRIDAPQFRGIILILELLRAIGHHRIEPHIAAPEHREAAAEVADQRVAVDAAAVLERVAVKEEIARHRAPLRADEEIESERPVQIVPVEVRRAGERGPDALRP